METSEDSEEETINIMEGGLLSLLLVFRAVKPSPFLWDALPCQRLVILSEQNVLLTFSMVLYSDRADAADFLSALLAWDDNPYDRTC